MKFALVFLIACQDPQNPSFVPTQTDLPVLRFTTEAPVVSKEESVAGRVSVDGGDALALQIKGHGNSSWLNWPKKPYKISLETKAEILGMPAGKDWILLANYGDKTLLRNALAFELSEQLGMTYTPRSRFVELFLNDEYKGVYQLAEQIKVGSNRVNISDKGLLIEVDAPDVDDVTFQTEAGLNIVVKAPKMPSVEDVRAQVQDIEDTLDESVIDFESAAKWYWVNELLENPDAAMHHSVYLYREPGMPLAFGPVWDFDTSAGNANDPSALSTSQYWIRGATWFRTLFLREAFAAEVAKQWATIDVNQLIAFIDARADALELAQQNNFQRWKILDTHVLGTPKGSYAAEVAALKDWLRAHAKWIEEQQ